MPEKIGALVGATKLHELLFEPDGKIIKKNIPTEAFYKAVKIKTGKKISRKK